MADDLVSIPCATCQAPIRVQREVERFLRQSQTTFYCLYGHPNVFSKRETEADKLRRERDLLKQQMARLEDEKRLLLNTANDQHARAEKERRRANGYKGHATRITKRVKAGVCPCCNRHFQKLEAHMANKHPDFTPIEIEEGAPA